MIEGAPKRYTAFLSSTQAGLEQEREGAYHALKAAQLDVVRMEDFQRDGTYPWDACAAAIEQCDLFVLLLGHEYGSEVHGSGRSYTHAEYEHARRYGLPVFAFVKAGLEAAALAGPDALRLQDFHATIRSAHLVSEPFAEPAELALLVVRELQGWQPPARGRPYFGRARERVSEPRSYALAQVRQAVLRREPYLVYLLDGVTALESPLPTEAQGLLLLKAREVHDELNAMGVAATFVNDVPAPAAAATPEAAFAERAQLVSDVASLVVCFAEGVGAYARTLPFHDIADRLMIVQRAGLDLSSEQRCEGATPLEYVEPEVDSCAVAKRTVRSVSDRVEAHLMEVY